MENMNYLFATQHYKLIYKGFKTTLNYQVIVEVYQFPNGVICVSIPDVNLLSTWPIQGIEEEEEEEELTHGMVGSKPHYAPRGFLGKVGQEAQIHGALPDVGHRFIYLMNKQHWCRSRQRNWSLNIVDALQSYEFHTICLVSRGW
jgi:hypothetical protein